MTASYPELDWFFAASEQSPAAADLMDRLLSSDPAIAGLAAYVALRGDIAVPSDTLTALAHALGRELDGLANQPCPLWLLALWAAVLRMADRQLEQPRFASLLSRVKNHAYANYTRAGTLTADSYKSKLDHSILLASVPFGLFEPEDLALVAAVNEMAAAGPYLSVDDTLILAWYYSEQGNYERSRALLAEAADRPLAAIVSRNLARQNQLADSFIRHLPMGNGNRYEPLYEERFPKLVSETDSVTVYARAAPLSSGNPVELILGETRLSGTLEAEGWRFDLPPRPAGTRVRYGFGFADQQMRGDTFEYEVLASRTAGRVLAVAPEADKIILVAENAEIALSHRDGQTSLSMAATSTRAGAVAAGRWMLVSCGVTVDDAGQIFIEIGEAWLRLGEIAWLEDSAGQVMSCEARLHSPRSGVFGLGERYNALDQYGHRVDQFVYNQYKNQGLRTYIPMPVFYTDAGFGMWLKTDSYSWFDFGLSEPESIRFGAEAAQLDLAFLSGSVAEQITQFIDLTGAPANVPDWALGPWMSSNNWDNQREVEKQLALTRQHAIPATVLVVEAWSDEATFYIFNDATYAPKPGGAAFSYEDFRFPDWGRWPDPKGMVEAIHAEGVKLILWQIPVIKNVSSLDHPQKNRDEKHFLEQGFGVRRPDGTALRLPEGWFKDSLLMDFTNADGKAWWFDKRRYLLDLGIDGFKTDGGEMVWGQDLVFADGSRGLTNRNRYPGDYISAYYDFAQASNGITFSRAGYTGAQAYPAHWAGDERSTWDAFKRSILAGLSAGMSGIIFWGWDMAGFSGEVPGAELYIRSTQMAAFCPIMQYHAESKAEFNQDRTPWNIAERSGDERALTLYAFYARLRMMLLPYFVAEAAHCVAARTPLMRPMLLDHAGDAEAVGLWDQYRLGRDLLVAPVIVEGATSREVYLPKGRWWHLLDETWHEGGDRRMVDAPLDSLPVYVRDGALVPLAFAEEARFGAELPVGLVEPRQLVLLLVASASAEGHVTAYGWDIAVTRTTDGAVECRIAGSGPEVTLVFTDPPSAVTVNGEMLEPVTTRLHRATLTAATVSRL